MISDMLNNKRVDSVVTGLLLLFLPHSLTLQSQKTFEVILHTTLQ